MTEELKITISGDAKALIAELKKAGVEVARFGEDTTKAGEKSKEAGTNVSELITRFGLVQKAQQAAGWVKDFAVESFNAAGQAERLGRATDSLAKGIGSSGQAMVGAITQASMGTISQMEAMAAANKALMFGLVQNEQEMASLTRIAVTLGAAMGQSAAKSIDDLSTALGRNSPLILDNLGISIKLEDAYRIYAQSVGKTVEALTEEEKAMAFRKAALIEGEKRVAALGGVVLDSAGKVEQAAATWEDFKVAFGNSMQALNSSFGIMEGAISLIERLKAGAEAWSYVFNEAIPAIKDHNAALAENAAKAVLAAESQAQVQEAVKQALNDTEAFRNALAAGSASYEQYIEASGRAASGNMWLAAQLRLTEEEYLALKQSMEAAAAQSEAAAAAQARAADSARAAGMAAYYQEEAQRASSAEAARWQAMAEANVETLNDLSRGHLTTAEEAKAYAEAQKEAAEAERERQETLTSLAGQMADYYLGLRELQEKYLGGEAEFNSSLASQQAEANQKRIEAEQKLTETLASLEQERQEKIAWVLSGAHTRTQEENDAALAHWNEHYEQLKQAATTKYQETTTAIEAELSKRQAAAAAAQEKEKAEYEAHLNELKMKTALGLLETTGQLEQLTGMVGLRASEAADLINAGILPVTQEMGLAIQSTLANLATQNQDTARTATENQMILQEAYAGTLQALNDQNIALGETMPANLLLVGESGAAMSATMTAGLETVQGGTEKANLLFETITNQTMPKLSASSATTSEAMTGHLGNVKRAGESTNNTLIDGFKRVVDKADNLISKLKEITEWLHEIERRARDAAQEMGRVTSGGGGGGGSPAGGRAAGGPVSAGNLYLVGEKGPELFIPNTSGFVAPFRSADPVEVSGQGSRGAGQASSLTIQNVNLFGVQDVWKLFEELRNVARINGLEFAVMR